MKICEHGQKSEFECLPCCRIAYGRAVRESQAYRNEIEGARLAAQSTAAQLHGLALAARRALRAMPPHELGPDCVADTITDERLCPICTLRDLLGGHDDVEV